MNWTDLLNQKAANELTIKESEILINLPCEFRENWDNFMRGKTCPILDDGDHGVYSWDLKYFLSIINKS
jgi:hypothetical protein